MNMDKKRLQQISFGFVILILLFLVGAYFIFFSPLQQSVNVAKSTLQTEEQLLQILQQNDQQSDELEEDGEFKEFIQKVPAKPYIEHWLVQLEQIESSSRSTIESYSFSKGELVLSNQESEDETTMDDQEGEEGLNTMTNIVHEVNASLVVTANSYERLYDFLNAVEKLNRITKVSAFSITEPTEEEESNNFTMNVNISTFYLPHLLQDYPDYDYDTLFLEPGRKTNPF
ncbi:type 4a pilus biogenesis protein PilO [Evansella tamaricis]|uniref:Type 4a pilus biogenesis protein PilO n=1 Tax=Evansella tamaricis TaxID=2069301 RepID=A0ABS6JBG7_9BACI|nr:type 4a pilus biogenesis protein PilO [Evansella tamaricis]MBU9711019.1 type 4a pilus biogenesis protein PilO [Evansella tamaricis]